LQRVNTDLTGTDKSDLLKLIENMQDKERAILWINRCITALLLLRKQLKKPFKDAAKQDIRSLLKWMDDKKYKASTIEKFRQILKLFYKTVYGNGEYYPEEVKWFSAKVGKEKHASSATIDLAEYLEEDEVLKLIEVATPLQKKAFLACMYELGARPEEILRLTNADFKIDCNGVVLVLRGKTGERALRLITYAKIFQQWIAVHPLKDEL
jgi:integrase